MKSFEALGDQLLEDIKPPPLLPRGTYLVGVTSMPEKFTASTGNEAWKYHIKFYQARDDVDRRELDAILTEREMSLTDFEMDDNFWMTDNAAYIHSAFLMDVMGFRGAGKTLNQAVAECSGKQYLATIGHQPYKRNDGTMGLRAQIAGRAKA